MMESYLHPVQRKKRHLAAKIVTAIVLVILVIFGIMLAFLFKDDNAGLTTAPSSDALKTILTNAVTGKESELSATQVNQLIAYQLKQKKTENAAFSSLYLSVNSDNTVNVYAPVTMKGMHFGVTAVANMTFDSKTNQLVATVKSMHVGRLGVPVNWALNVAKDKLPTGVKVDGDKLLVDASRISFPIDGTKSELTLSGLQVKNSKFLLQTTGMSDVIKDYLAKAGGQLQGLLK